MKNGIFEIILFIDILNGYVFYSLNREFQFLYKLRAVLELHCI